MQVNTVTSNNSSSDRGVAHSYFGKANGGAGCLGSVDLRRSRQTKSRVSLDRIAEDQYRAKPQGSLSLLHPNAGSKRLL